ncbi:hypothetical protein B0T14DRAFT_519666 [Immersiella caudata]|uniref:Heterokaryon incompatibility domain-containing protein n=1 Tax=Immersiella caudata TaxID=314043 RepID=A0AA39WQE3_9PEZI|nr:hypothetical protein B0T14DRAFT_519666 [Immersiella caudata]
MLCSSLGSNRIRLAKFASGQRFELELQEVSLESCPPHIAISYTWGSLRDRTSLEICCNPPGCDSANCRSGNHRVLVPKNLGSALQRLRQLNLHEGTDIAFWADSICIDQSNRVERNRQVPLMRQNIHWCQGSHGVFRQGFASRIRELPFQLAGRQLPSVVARGVV